MGSCVPVSLAMVTLTARLCREVWPPPVFITPQLTSASLNREGVFGRFRLVIVVEIVASRGVGWRRPAGVPLGRVYASGSGGADREGWEAQHEEPSLGVRFRLARLFVTEASRAPVRAAHIWAFPGNRTLATAVVP